MPTSIDLLRTFAGTFDLDIQLWAARLLRQLRNTTAGQRFIAWATSNPTAFHSLLMALSAASSRLPSNRGLPLELVRQHLLRLPLEIRRIAFDEGVYSQLSGLDFLEDAAFVERYEKAVTLVSPDELEQVACLSPTRLKEWVNTPQAIRAAKLRTWRGEPSSPVDAAFGAMADFLEGFLGVEQVPTTPAELSDAEVVVLRALAARDSFRLSLTEIQESLGLKRIALEVALSTLQRRNLVRRTTLGRAWCLTDSAKEFVVHNGLI